MRNSKSYDFNGLKQTGNSPFQPGNPSSFFQSPSLNNFQSSSPDSNKMTNTNQIHSPSKTPLRTLHHSPRKSPRVPYQEVSPSSSKKFAEWIERAYEIKLLSPIRVACNGNSKDVKMYLMHQKDLIPYEFSTINFEDFRILLLNEIEKRKKSLASWLSSTSLGVDVSEFDKKANEVVKEKERIDFLTEICYCLSSYKKDKQNQTVAKRIRSFAPPTKLKL